MSTYFKFLLSLLMLTSVSFGVSAQEDEDEADDVEEVVVTGSRIARTSNYESVGPVEVITVEQVRDSGKNNIGDYLIELPSANLASNQRSINNGNSGTTEVNLRGAGSGRLLTLINGRRVAPTGTGIGNAVDFQIFPLAMIESVEVLKDGAAAVYGSDAVSGVINVKLREFEGSEFFGSTGSSAQGDANSSEFSFAFGTKGERSSNVTAISWYQNDSLGMNERDFAHCPRIEPYYMLFVQALVGGHGDYGDNVGNNDSSCGASSFIPSGRFYTSTGSQTIYAAGGQIEPWGFWDFSGSNSGNMTGRGMYNYSEYMELLGDRENFQFMTDGKYETNAGVTLDYNIMYSKRLSGLQMAPVPMGAGAQVTYGLTIPSDNAFNPLGESFTYRKRMLDVGPRLFSQEADTLRIVVGASGDLDFLGLDGASWEAYSVVHRFTSGNETKNYIDMYRVEQALTTEVGPGVVGYDGQQYRCADPLARQLGCVPLNMFGPGSITQAAGDFIRYNKKDKLLTEADEYAFNVSNVTLFDLPAGPVAMAFGFDKFVLYGEDNVDGLTEAGLSSGNPRLSTAGGYTSEDAYFEVQVPILADTFLAEELRVEFAGRQSEFDLFEGDNVERLSVFWKPHPDLTVRGTDSTSYRAPTISNLYFGGGGGFPTYVDVCTSAYVSSVDPATAAALTTNCAAIAGLDTSTWITSNNQILALSVGNVNLTPEAGESLTYGLVYQPSFRLLEPFNVALAIDYFELDVGNAVVGSGVLNTLLRCYRDADTDYCGRISRPVGGDVVSVETLNVNSDSVDHYEGYDVSATATFDDLPFVGGSLRAQIQWTHLVENTTVDASGVSDDYVGQCYDFGESCFARDRSNGIFTYSNGDWTATWVTRFMSGISPGQDTVDFFAEDPFYGGPMDPALFDRVMDAYSIPDFYYHNASVAYDYNENTRLNLAVTNVFDKEPDYYKQLFGFYDPQISTPQNSYDFVGRYINVSVSYSF